MEKQYRVLKDSEAMNETLINELAEQGYRICNAVTINVQYINPKIIVYMERWHDDDEQDSTSETDERE